MEGHPNSLGPLLWGGEGGGLFDGQWPAIPIVFLTSKGDILMGIEYLGWYVFGGEEGVQALRMWDILMGIE